MIGKTGLNTLTIEDKNILINAFCSHITVCFEIELKTRKFRKVMSDYLDKDLFPGCKTTDDLKEIFMQTVGDESQKEQMESFFDMSTVSDRLGVKTFLETEFLMQNGEWRKAMFLKSRYDKKGQLTHVLLAIGLIEQAKLEELMRIREMERRFYSSIMAKSFIPFFQPKYDSDTGKIMGAEALVRRQNEDGGYEMPYHFIEEFEKNGLIYYLDEYMFERVCEFQSQQIQNGERIIPISVNISRASLCFMNALENYLKIAHKYNIDLSCVPLEITESALIENAELVPIVQSFSENGFVLHIDDFGSGYSALSNLCIFDIKTIKIDKSLIDCIGNAFGESLLKHVIDFAHQFNIGIVAEGVETTGQVEFLHTIHCDLIQGFYYSKPMSSNEFKEQI